MRAIFDGFTWRTGTIAALAVAALVSLCNENEDFPAIILSRVAGLAFAAVAWILARHWGRKGKLPRIDE